MALVRVSGIYKIQSKINKKFYIGSSVFIGKRWQKHLNCLKTNKHANCHLQNHTNKYGIEDLEFSIIETTEDIYKDNYKILVDKEQFYIDTLSPEFNLQKIVGSNLNCRYLNSKYYHYHKASKLYIVSCLILGQSLNFSYHKTKESAIKQAEFVKTLSDEEATTYAQSLRKKVKNYSYDVKTKKFIVQFDIHGKTQRLNAFSTEGEAIELAKYLRSLTKVDLETYLKEYREIQKARTGKYYYFCKIIKRYIVSYPVDGKFDKIKSFAEEKEAIDLVTQLKSMPSSEISEAYSKKRQPKYYRFCKITKKYIVTFTVEGKQKCFGRYENEQEAVSRVEELKPVILPLLERYRNINNIKPNT